MSPKIEIGDADSGTVELVESDAAAVEMQMPTAADLSGDVQGDAAAVEMRTPTAADTNFDVEDSTRGESEPHLHEVCSLATCLPLFTRCVGDRKGCGQARKRWAAARAAAALVAAVLVALLLAQRHDYYTEYGAGRTGEGAVRRRLGTVVFRPLKLDCEELDGHKVRPPASFPRRASRARSVPRRASKTRPTRRTSPSSTTRSGSSTPSGPWSSAPRARAT